MPKKTKQQDVVKMRDLLESGVHFGHQTRRWNPKMKPYIFTSRNGIHVIDLQKTVSLIEDACEFVTKLTSENKKILFVGTKKQAQEVILEEASKAKMPYVNQRWLGGTLTNNTTIRQSINKLKSFERDCESGLMASLRKRSVTSYKTMQRLQFYLNGIRDMVSLPSAILLWMLRKSN